MRRKKPTKLEIKRARAKQKKARALQREAWKVLKIVRRLQRRSLVRRPVDEPTEIFHTWQHDFQVLLPAVVRSAGSEGLTPEEVVSRTALAADQMRETVAARRPEGFDPLMGRRRDGRRGPMRDWFRWQSAFDGFVHDMCDRATMPASQIVERAVAFADLSIAEIERRRPGKRKTVTS